MKTSLWIKVDTIIVILNKMESLLSLILIFTGTTGFTGENDFFIRTSFFLIIVLGLTTLLLISLYMWRRINDQNFVRSFYISKGKDIKKQFNSNYRIPFINSGLPEAKYIEMEKEEIVVAILKIRQRYSFGYIKKLLDNTYDELN